MLSRAACRIVQPLRPIALSIRGTSDVVNAQSGVRNEVDFPRPKRLIEPGKVRMGFIPEEWFTFFHKKTGVTGPYIFGVGLINYLVSKEFYVLDHEFRLGIATLIILIVGCKKFGPALAKFCDSEMKKEEDMFNQGRIDAVNGYEEAIKSEKTEQWRADGQFMLFDAKKENVLLQLEATYRERMMQVYKEVKLRLDYQVERQNIDRRISQKHMVQWIVNNVLRSITPEQEKETLNKCIADLSLLAAKQ